MSVPRHAVAALLGLIVPAAAHNSLITPKPRNAIDSELPEWSHGKAPYVWKPSGGGHIIEREYASGMSVY